MKKTVFITGASRGIGFALAELFIRNGYKVIGTSTSGKTDRDDSNLEIIQLELARMESIKNADELLRQKGLKIDILVNNAAIGPDLDNLLPDEESFRQTFEVNVTGTVFFTEALIKHLNPDAKIINISSKMGSIGLCQGTDSVAYRMSKTALNMYSKILANRLAGKHKVATIHPGWVRTDLTGSNVNAPLSGEESGREIFEFIESDFRSGIYWNAPEQSEIEW